MSVNVIKVSKTSLKAPLSVTGGTISVNSFKDSQGNKLNLSDFGEFFTIVIKQGDTEEIIKCDGITQNLDDTADLSVASSGRDISPKPPYDGASSGNDFSAGSQVICSNDPLIMSLFASVENEQTWQEIQTFQKLPKITAGDPVDDNDVPTKGYVDTAATGGATVPRIIVEGTAGGTIDTGDFIYLDVSDGEWKKTDASNSATCDNVLLGIAQGNGTDGNSITGGVLIQGKDANQSSLTAGNTYYLTDTAGAIGTTAGTVEVEVGYAISTSEIYFAPKFNTKLTKDQKDALAGTSGTPSSSNKYVTDDDTEGTGNVIRKSVFSNVPYEEAEYTTPGSYTWSVPSGVKVIEVVVVGGGGGGGCSGSGDNGESSSFGDGSESFSQIIASGGQGGGSGFNDRDGATPNNGLASGNGGGGAEDESLSQTGGAGTGGEIKRKYVDVSNDSSVAITVGAGGAGAPADHSGAGADGGSGEVSIKVIR